MFQNVNENTIDVDSKNASDDKNKVNIFANIFTKDNIVLYLVSFMLSFVGLGGEFSIFSVSMLGACISLEIPVLGIIVVSLLGNFLKFGLGGLIGYFISSLVLIIGLFVFKPRYNEQERNEKIKIGKNIFSSVLVIQIIKIMAFGFTFYDTLASITLAMIALVFYKIFVNSVVLLKEFYKKRAFTVEEVIGASLLFAIAVCGFGDFGVLGFSIRNIFSVLIVMILGWKKGMLIGTTSGVTIGITLGVISGSEPIMIAAYAISGLIAGILNRFGRIGVIIGFVLGNVVLAYVSNGFSVELIHFEEILIASIGLLVFPKNLDIELEEFIGNNKLFPIIPSRALNKSKEMVENLNNVSEAIQTMAKTYKNTEPKTFEENTEKNENKQIFISELLNNLEPYKDNMLYEDVTNVDGDIINKIFELLIDKQEITNQDLIKIFAECNSYIVGFEDENINKYLNENISQIVRNINVAYKISKSNFIWKKKEEQSKTNMEKQLNEVSKAIKNMAVGLENDINDEDKFAEEKEEILEKIKSNGVDIQDISIKKKNRFIIEIYLNEFIENSKIEKISKILTKVLKERIVLNSEASVGKKLNFLSDDRYVMAIGKSVATKAGSEESGDSNLNVRLKDGKYLVALSDGMGSGKDAKESSMKVLRLLENLLLSGFDKEISLDLINTSLINQNKEVFSTLDIAIVDLYMGTIEFIKSGACPTYIKNKKRVQIIKSNSLPTGIVEENNIQTFDKDIEHGDIMLMCTDGILDSNIEYKNKELWVKYMLEDIETNNTQKIADIILNEAIDNNLGAVKDDMSVLVCKFVENK